MSVLSRNLPLWSISRFYQIIVNCCSAQNYKLLMIWHVHNLYSTHWLECGIFSRCKRLDHPVIIYLYVYTWYCFFLLKYQCIVVWCRFKGRCLFCRCWQRQILTADILQCICTVMCANCYVLIIFGHTPASKPSIGITLVLRVCSFGHVSFVNFLVQLVAKRFVRSSPYSWVVNIQDQWNNWA